MFSSIGVKAVKRRTNKAKPQLGCFHAMFLEFKVKLPGLAKAHYPSSAISTRLAVTGAQHWTRASHPHTEGHAAVPTSQNRPLHPARRTQTTEHCARNKLSGKQWESANLFSSLQHTWLTEFLNVHMVGVGRILLACFRVWGCSLWEFFSCVCWGGGLH